MTNHDQTATAAARARRNKRGQRGAALVEFAVIAPLFILIIFGVLDFGRALNYWNNSMHWAATGARFAVVDANPGEGSGQSLTEWIHSQGATSEMRDSSRVCIDFMGDAEPVAGDPVRVRVETDFAWLPYIGGKLGVATTTMRGEAVMRLERPPTVYSDGESFGGACS